jgi:hypothetical protein
VPVEFNLIVTPAAATKLAAYNATKRFSDFEPLHAEVSSGNSLSPCILILSPW